VEGDRRGDHEDVFQGLMLIVSGLFRKCVIADNCAMLADAAFSGKLGPPSLGVLLIGASAFAWQIYGDFSGYSQIARGSAKLLGFDFMINFQQPYLATSLRDFWHRWHISLSTWLRDYLYIRLGGSRGSEIQTWRNLFLTMTIGGFWHGANWTYLVWGMLHGLGLVVERWSGWARVAAVRGAALSLNGTVRIWLMRAAVFHIVCLAWVFFRTPDLGVAITMLKGALVLDWRPELTGAFVYLAAFSVPMLLLDLSNERRQEEFPLQKAGLPVQIAVGGSLAAAVMLLAGVSTHAFIYFQF
jgi:D-alanyl-lipoteichoic acid acyltransferase DltB (MBOAT superfamily)